MTRIMDQERRLRLAELVILGLTLTATLGIGGAV